MIRQAYIWYVPTNADAHARKLVEMGATEVRVKAGGDYGNLWAQWVNPAVTQPYRDAGLRVTPWFYVWPVQPDIDVIARAYAAQPFDEYALNPETEWRWRNSNENPWNNLTQANAGARDWIRRLKATLPGKRIAYSGVPTWVDFPYEAFAAECDQAEPQHYWPDNLMAPDGEIGDEAGEDEVEAHIRRAGTTQPTVPILTACQEYSNLEVVALGKNALGDYPNLAGFSAWEAGNVNFQWQAIGQVYLLLPPDVQAQATTDKDGEEGVIRGYVNEKGEAIVEINFKGVATDVLGVNAQDVGVSVLGRNRATYDRSVLQNRFQPWRKR